MPEPLIEIKNLSINAEEKPLVRSLSLQLYPQKIMGLVGESGSGKTLTALSILGLLPPQIQMTEGEILFRNNNTLKDIATLSNHELNKIRGSKIAMIFQEPMTSLNPSMRCGRQAMEPLLKQGNLSKKEVKNKVLELFEEVRLPDVKRIFTAWPHELSGGQRQRVMIAMALSSSPNLLIADEPTTALDVTVQKNILELLLDLREKFNLSILFITHDLMVIKQIADDVSVMYQGEIIEYGSKKEILENPLTNYTKSLLACKPSLNEKPYRLKTISHVDGDSEIEMNRDSNLGSSTLSEKEWDKNSAINRIQELDQQDIKNASLNSEIILSVKNLSVSYGSRNKRIAVDNLSFDVFRGETLGLVGESGCGKTSLGRAILQLLETSQGSVEYNGIALNKLKARNLRNIRRKIQIVFQDPYSSLNPGKTIAHILSEPMRVHQLKNGRKEIIAACEKLLEQVDLPKASMNLYPHQFSGGQRQRIGIARALACEPEFMILDESVSALDVSVQAQVLNLLNELKEQYNLSYIFISHDLTVVKYMSDRVMVMSEGKIVESGLSEQIYLNPAEEYTKTLIAAIPG